MPFVEYYMAEIHPDVTSSLGRWVLEDLNMYHLYSGVTTNQSEGLYWNVFNCGEKHPLICSLPGTYFTYVYFTLVWLCYVCWITYTQLYMYMYVCIYSSGGTTTMRFSVACARLVTTAFCRSTNLSVDLVRSWRPSVVSLLKILLIVFTMVRSQITNQD